MKLNLTRVCMNSLYDYSKVYNVKVWSVEKEEYVQEIKVEDVTCSSFYEMLGQVKSHKNDGIEIVFNEMNFVEFFEPNGNTRFFVDIIKDYLGLQETQQ